MSDEEEDEGPAFTFFLSWFGFTMVVFPFVATLNATIFDGNLGQFMVPVISLVATIPAALEFAFSNRDPYKVGMFVGAFVLLFFLTIILQAGIAVAMDAQESDAVIQFGLMFAAYIGAYVIVYRIGFDRIKRAVTG